MRLRSFLSIAVAIGLAASASRARGGEVRINVANFAFTPASVTVNLGDHIVWVWMNGQHSVTSGSDGSASGNGIFNSGITSFGTAPNNSAFTWKSDRTGPVPFYCIPHWPDMTGTINVQAGTGAAVADFRITEVMYTAAGNLDLIEITNQGTGAGDLGRYRLAIPGDVEGIPITSVSVFPGSIVVVHPATSGTNSSTSVFVPSLNALPDAAGSVALYAPNTIAGSTALTDASQIIDFVEYGAGGQANEATAAAAGLWTAGEFVPVVGSASHSIEFCGNRADHGAAQWAEISSPNFGSNGNCITPALPSTWGRLKVMYR